MLPGSPGNQGVPLFDMRPGFGRMAACLCGRLVPLMNSVTAGTAAISAPLREKM